MTVVLSTHVLQEVEAICHRVLVIHRGELVARDRVEALSATRGVVTVTVLEPTTELLAALGAIDGVVGVSQPEAGRYQVRSERDVRADVARVAVPFGLVELTSARGLEEVFLHLTAEPA